MHAYRLLIPDVYAEGVGNNLKFRLPLTLFLKGEIYDLTISFDG